MPPKAPSRFETVNKELLLLLSLFLIAGLLNVLADAQRMVLGFYSLPTVAATYLYGRRYAVLTAFGSVLLALIVTSLPTAQIGVWKFPDPRQLADLIAWGGMLLVTGYLMGTVVEIKNAQVRELRQTHDGVLVLLHHLMSKDEYNEHHSYRVSEYATRIAGRLGLEASRLEDIRAAGLLHEIGTLDFSRDLLSKAAGFTDARHAGTERPAGDRVATIEALGASLGRVIPIVLAHHDRVDGRGHHAATGEDLPVGARVIAVADAYDSLTTARPYRQAMSPFDAKSIIEKGSGTDFDPKVVEAFLTAFRFGELDSRTAAAVA